MIQASPQPANNPTALHDDPNWMEAMEFTSYIDNWLKTHAQEPQPQEPKDTPMNTSIKPTNPEHIALPPITTRLEMIADSIEQLDEIKAASKERQDLPLFSLCKVVEQLAASLLLPQAPTEQGGRLISQTIFNPPITVQAGDNVVLPAQPAPAAQPAHPAPAPAQPALVPTATPTAALQPQGIRGTSQSFAVILRVDLKKSADSLRVQELKHMIAARAYTVQGVCNVEVM